MKLLVILSKVIFVTLLGVLGLYIGKNLDNQQMVREKAYGDTARLGQIVADVDTSVDTFLRAERVDLYTADRKVLQGLGFTDKSCDILLPSIIYRPVDLNKLGLRGEQKALALRSLLW